MKAGVWLYVQVMQNVSNLQEEMEAKEPFMHPMNCLMPEGVARVKTFIQSLVQIDQKEGGCVRSHDTGVMSHDIAVVLWHSLCGARGEGRWLHPSPHPL